MDHRATRSTFAAAAILLAGGPLAARAGSPEELSARVIPLSTGISVHDASETLRDWCRADENGVLWLVLPGGARFELVTSTADPAISNHGDGSFHPFDAIEVRAALGSVSYPLEGIAAEVFILPYPRRAGLSSAAGPGVVLLSPGVYPLTSEQQHAEFVHELGHLVQYSRLPDGDGGWTRYRSIRGITDLTVYCDDAVHPDRPHEIFAEDFRALFGDPLATTSGRIENDALLPPALVPGLPQFLLELSGQPLSVALAAVPNPARGPIGFARAGAAPADLEIFDVAGRRVVRLAPSQHGPWIRWTWDGRDASGREVEAGVVFARPRDGGPALRVTILR